jgi:hypothetical protein
MNMRAIHRRLILTLAALALLFVGCSDPDQLVAPAPAPAPAGDALSALLGQDAEAFHEITLLRAPGPDGVMLTDDDVFTRLWPDKYNTVASPPGHLWRALGVDLEPLDAAGAFTVLSDCFGSHVPTTLNYNGGVRITFLDPETSAARTASWVSVEVRNPPVKLKAFDEAGELLGVESLSTASGFLTVSAPGIARAELTGSFWCLSHRIRFVLDQPVQMVVDETPPVLDLTVTPEVLWPANHRYRTVDVVADATDDTADPADLVVVAEVVSSDPDNAKGNGDGNTTGDIRVTRADGTVLLSSNESPVVTFDPRTDQLELRAERAAGGGGRVYTVAVTATDPSGNFTTEVATVAVPLSSPR